MFWLLSKKSHTSNYYSFLQKFLLKTKSYKVVVGNCIAQFTSTTTNSEKDIYFLSLISCSINKRFTWKKFFCSTKRGGGGTGAPCPPFSTALLRDAKRNAFILTDFWILVHHIKFLKRVCDLFILIDSVVKHVHFKRRQTLVSLKMTNIIYLIRESSAISLTNTLNQDLTNLSNIF